MAVSFTGRVYNALTVGNIDDPVFIKTPCPPCPDIYDEILGTNESVILDALQQANKQNSILPGLLNLNSVSQIRAALILNSTLDDFIQILQNADLDNLTSAQITYLIGRFGATEINQLSAAQIQLLINSQLDHLSATQLNYIVTILQQTQLQLLSNVQLLLLSSAQQLYLFRQVLDTISAVDLLTESRDTLTHKNRITDSIAPNLNFIEGNTIPPAIMNQGGLKLQYCIFYH